MMPERRTILSDYFVEHTDPVDGYSGQFRLIYGAKREPDNTIELSASTELYTLNEARNLSQLFVNNKVESPIKNLGIDRNKI